MPRVGSSKMMQPRLHRQPLGEHDLLLVAARERERRCRDRWARGCRAWTSAVRRAWRGSSALRITDQAATRVGRAGWRARCSPRSRGRACRPHALAVLRHEIDAAGDGIGPRRARMISARAPVEPDHFAAEASGRCRRSRGQVRCGRSRPVRPAPGSRRGVHGEVDGGRDRRWCARRLEAPSTTSPGGRRPAAGRAILRSRPIIRRIISAVRRSALRPGGRPCLPSRSTSHPVGAGAPPRSAGGR